MTKRSKEIDRLARDICWAEFPVAPKGATKVSYWRGVKPAAKESYIESAKWLVFIVGKLKPLRLMAQIMDIPK